VYRGAGHPQQKRKKGKEEEKRKGKSNGGGLGELGLVKLGHPTEGMSTWSEGGTGKGKGNGTSRSKRTSPVVARKNREYKAT